MTHRITPTSPTPAGEPEFTDLTQRECEDVLRRGHVGRVAFSHGNRVDIEPIGYAYDDGWLFGRTSPGTKLTALGHRPWVAFQVDEVRGWFDWDSVVAHGSFRTLEPEGNEADLELYARALARLREVDPTIGTEADPAPFRSILFAIYVDEKTGRRARS